MTDDRASSLNHRDVLAFVFASSRLAPIDSVEARDVVRSKRNKSTYRTSYEVFLSTVLMKHKKGPTPGGPLRRDMFFFTQ